MRTVLYSMMQAALTSSVVTETLHSLMTNASPQVCEMRSWQRDGDGDGDGEAEGVLVIKSSIDDGAPCICECGELRQGVRGKLFPSYREDEARPEDYSMYSLSRSTSADCIGLDLKADQRQRAKPRRQRGTARARHGRNRQEKVPGPRSASRAYASAYVQYSALKGISSVRGLRL